MFDRILSWLESGWKWLKPFHVIDAWETGACLRFGRFHREMAPGFHWKWPLIEEVHEYTTTKQTMRLLAQTVDTKDRKQVVVTTVVKYEIADISKFITQIFDQKDVLGDVTMGAVRDEVAGMTYEDLIATPPTKSILDMVRKECNQYGFKIHRVTFVDLSRTRSLRLIQGNPTDLDN